MEELKKLCWPTVIRACDRSNVMVLSQRADVQLRIRDEDFDNDTFLSASKIRDISKLVGDEFEKAVPEPY